MIWNMVQPKSKDYLNDLVPISTIEKFLACIYVFTDMALGGLILSNAADYIIEKQ
jgi:potassium channel subfamily K, other eukaryote